MTLTVTEKGYYAASRHGRPGHGGPRGRRGPRRDGDTSTGRRPRHGRRQARPHPSPPVTGPAEPRSTSCPATTWPPTAQPSRASSGASCEASAWADGGRMLDWLGTAVGFPATVVDRIVPATTDEDRDIVAAALGVRDEMAGRGGALPAVGARGLLRRAAAAVGTRRGVVRRGRRAVSADEAAPAQRLPLGHGLPGQPRAAGRSPR